MRGLIIVALAVGAACASLGPPPGGPQRKDPPTILSVSPESGAVNVAARSAVVAFDAIVDDKSGRGGRLDGSVLLSPSDGGTVVRWRRDRIEVRPRRGFRANTAYSLTILPGIADLNRNAMTVGRTITFSTGPTIPPYRIHGRVFDWLAERILADALVEVVRRPDSLPYMGVSDSTGQFAIGPLEEGSYAVRAIVDNNRNGELDASEPWDSLSIVVRGVSPFVELLAAPRDTVGPRLLTVTVTDSFTLHASFDRPLDPLAPFGAGSFRIQAADSTRLTLRRAVTRAQHDAIRAAEDSVAGRDSVARRPVEVMPPAPPQPAPRRDPVAALAPGLVAPPRPSRPAPTRDVVIVLDSTSPLRPEATYRVTAVSVFGLTGITRTSDRLITVPRPDTTRAPRDRP